MVILHLIYGEYTCLGLTGRSEIVSIPWKKSNVTTRSFRKFGVHTNKSGGSGPGNLEGSHSRVLDPRTRPSSCFHKSNDIKDWTLVRWGNEKSRSKFQMSIVNGMLIVELDVSAPKREIFSYFKEMVEYKRRSESSDPKAVNGKEDLDDSTAVEAFLQGECEIVKIHFTCGSTNLAAGFFPCSQTCLIDNVPQARKWQKCKGALVVSLGTGGLAQENMEAVSRYAEID